MMVSKVKRVKHGMRLTTALKNLGQFLGPVLVEQLVGLVDDCVLDAAHGDDIRLIHERAHTSGGGDENVAALAEIAHLLAHRVATVGGAWTEHGLVAHAARLIENLNRQLARGDDDDHKGLGANTVAACVIAGLGVVDSWARAPKLLRLAHELIQNWNEVRGCLPGAWWVMLVGDRQEVDPNLPVRATATTSWPEITAGMV